MVDFKVKAIRLETADVKSFVLEPPAGFTYLPGQFLTVIVPHTGEEIRRSYSFSSHPTSGLPTITVKRIANGEASRWLFDHVKVDDIIRTIGASGFFTLPSDLSSYDTLFFMAAGSGITPVISLIREALAKDGLQQIVLLYSNRNPSQTIFHEELNELQIEYKHKFSIEYFFSNHMSLDRARLSRLTIESILDEKVRDRSRAIFFVCGPHVYMQNISITLLTDGVPAENIRREIFFNPAPTVIVAPPDKGPHQVSVSYKGQHFSFEVRYPKSILQTAKSLGIELPYSCEAGRCGTCAATCTKGKVWMLRNEVLLDKEMERGRVLTCTGYPIGGDAELSF